MFNFFRKPKQVIVTKQMATCDECSGSGRWYSYTEQEVITCSKCKGKCKIEQEVYDYKY